MKIILAIVGLVCIGIGTLIFFLIIKPSLDAKNILKNGVETTATLVDIGNMSSNEAYYWLKLSFVNSDGETITCKTKSLYPQSYIRGDGGIAEYMYTTTYINAAGETITHKSISKISASYFKEQGITEYKYTDKFELTQEPLQVMYVGDKTVLKEFVPEDAGWSTWLIPGFFGGIGVLILLGLALVPVIGIFPIVGQVIAFLGLVFIGFVFAGIGASVYFWVLKPPMEATKILKNGTETTATVVEVIDSKVSTTTTTSSGSSKKVISNRLYRLTLAFVNAKGEEIIYETKTIYTGSFIERMKIAEKETVQVVRLGNKAIVKGYEPDSTDDWLWIFSIVFGAIGIAFWLIIAWGIIKSIDEFIIKKHGFETTGIYLKHEKFTVPNKKNETESPACNIFFTYKNQNGEIVEVQTGYLSYKVHEAEALAEMKTFSVKYKGKKAIIMVDKNALEKK